MAAYRLVYDSRTCRLTAMTGISSGTIRSVIEYGLPFLLIQSLFTVRGYTALVYNSTHLSLLPSAGL